MNFSYLMQTLIACEVFLLYFIQAQESYKPCVVEYYENKKIDLLPSDLLKENIDVYKSLIEDASSEGGHIIIFPEGGFTNYIINAYPAEQLGPYATLVPNPEENYNPCENRYYNNVKLRLQIFTISCLAKRNEIYVVINVIEKYYDKYYNTNVVFDQSGTIIARARKINLLYEKEFSSLKLQIEHYKFNTTFGVTFGILTSNDIFNEQLLKNLTSHYKINNFISTGAWRNGFDMSIIPSISLYQMFAYYYNVNWLFSGLYNKDQNMTGTGICNPDCNNYEFSLNKNESKMICKPINSIPKQIVAHTQEIAYATYSNLHKLKEGYERFIYNLTLKIVKVFDKTVNKICAFEGNISESDGYRLAIFDGNINTFLDANVLDRKLYIKLCAILYCKIETDCGQMPKYPLDNVINGKITTESDSMMPLIIDSDLSYPTNANIYQKFNKTIIFNASSMLFIGFYSSAYKKVAEPMSTSVTPTKPHLKNNYLPIIIVCAILISVFIMVILIIIIVKQNMHRCNSTMSG